MRQKRRCRLNSETAVQPAETKEIWERFLTQVERLYNMSSFECISPCEHFFYYIYTLTGVNFPYVPTTPRFSALWPCRCDKETRQLTTTFSSWQSEQTYLYPWTRQRTISSVVHVAMTSKSNQKLRECYPAKRGAVQMTPRWYKSVSTKKRRLFYYGSHLCELGGLAILRRAICFPSLNVYR